MGWLTQAATMQLPEAMQALVAEQRETNRLLRKMVGEEQPEYEVSDFSMAARLTRKADAKAARKAAR